MRTKTVDYYGLDIILHDEYFFLAVDSNNKLYAYSNTPALGRNTFMCVIGEYCYITTLDANNIQWKDSMVEYDDMGNMVHKSTIN